MTSRRSGVCCGRRDFESGPHNRAFKTAMWKYRWNLLEAYRAAIKSVAVRGKNIFKKDTKKSQQGFGRGTGASFTGCVSFLFFLTPCIFTHDASRPAGTGALAWGSRGYPGAPVLLGRTRRGPWRPRKGSKRAKRSGTVERSGNTGPIHRRTVVTREPPPKLCILGTRPAPPPAD